MTWASSVSRGGRLITWRTSGRRWRKSSRARLTLCLCVTCPTVAVLMQQHAQLATEQVLARLAKHAAAASAAAVLGGAGPEAIGDGDGAVAAAAAAALDDAGGGGKMPPKQVGHDGMPQSISRCLSCHHRLSLSPTHRQMTTRWSACLPLSFCT